MHVNMVNIITSIKQIYAYADVRYLNNDPTLPRHLSEFSRYMTKNYYKNIISLKYDPNIKQRQKILNKVGRLGLFKKTKFSMLHMYKKMTSVCFSGKNQNFKFKLPANLIKFEVFNHELCKFKLPPSLEYLKHWTNCNQKIVKLPQTIKKLCLNGKIKFKIHRFPKNLKYLSFKGQYTHCLDNLPYGLLILINYCEMVNIKSLPSTLIYLDFDVAKNISYENDFYQCLPQSLKFLNLGQNFHNLHLIQLPNKLEILVIGNTFIRTLEQLPKTLKRIVCNETYPFIDTLFTNKIWQLYLIHNKSEEDWIACGYYMEDMFQEYMEEQKIKFNNRQIIHLFGQHTLKYLLKKFRRQIRKNYYNQYFMVKKTIIPPNYP